MSDYQKAVVTSPVGPLRVVARAGRLVLLQAEERWGGGTKRLRDRAALEEARPAADPAGSVTALGRYFDGDLSALDEVAVGPEGTDFQRRVWAALRRVPPGTTASYRDIAEAIGAPAAVRAVGAANAANPVGIVVPCHRIIRADGGLGGYAGGLDTKRWLLTHEGAPLPRS